MGAAVGVGRWLPESVCYAEYSNMRPRLETRSLCSMSEPKYNFKDWTAETQGLRWNIRNWRQWIKQKPEDCDEKLKLTSGHELMENNEIFRQQNYWLWRQTTWESRKPNVKREEFYEQNCLFKKRCCGAITKSGPDTSLALDQDRSRKIEDQDSEK